MREPLESIGGSSEHHRIEREWSAMNESGRDCATRVAGHGVGEKDWNEGFQGKVVQRAAERSH